MKFKCKKTGKIIEWNPIMINAALVSAQNRKRLFWTNIPNVTQPEDKGILLKDVLEKDVDEKYTVKTKLSEKWNSDKPMAEDSEKYRTLRLGGNNPMIRVGQIGKGGQGDRVYSPEGKSVNLSANGGGRGAKTGLYLVGLIDGKNSQGKRVYSPEGKSTTLGAGTTAGGESGRRTGLYAVSQRGRYLVNGKRKDVLGAKTEQRIEIGSSEKAHTITSVFKDSMIMEDMQIRKLTPIECERLQGLPDNYTAYGEVLQEINIFGNMEIWKNVLSKTAKGKSKQISVPVLCTTNAISDMESSSFLLEKLNPVYCVIGNLSQKGGVETTTIIGIGTETQNIQIRLENIIGQPLEASTDIYEMVMGSGDIEILWKSISEELSEEMKSYTISTLTNLIIGLKTSISVQEANTCLFITNLKNLLQNSSKTEQSVSKMEHTTSISSTQRYKALGNAFNVDVVAHILKFIK